MSSNTTSYLLDTHAFVWLLLGDDTLKNQDILEKAALLGKLKVSAITCWEIGMLASRGRIHLGLPCDEWLHKALTLPGLTLEPLSPRIAVESSYLPGDLHGDPADRIIVATARMTHSTLVTRDEKILAYGEQGFVNTLAC